MGVLSYAALWRLYRFQFLSSDANSKKSSCKNHGLPRLPGVTSSFPQGPCSQGRVIQWLFHGTGTETTQPNLEKWKEGKPVLLTQQRRGRGLAWGTFPEDLCQEKLTAKSGQDARIPFSKICHRILTDHLSKKCCYVLHPVLGMVR